MRIITGQWKGRRVEAAPGSRPTGDRVREALFSILGGQVSGLFADLYCGGGAVGLEARSRGAEVVFVERDPSALETLRANLETLDVTGGVRVGEEDVRRFLKRPDVPADLLPARVVFADPPYDYGPTGKLLRLLADTPLVGPQTVVVVEHRRGRGLPRTEGLALERDETYGETVLSFFRKDESSSRA